MRRLSVVAVVPSAGYGRRLGLKTKKPFILLKGKPLVTYALKVLNESDCVDAIVIACERPCVDKFRSLVRKFRFDKVTDIVIGGRTRFESVRNCLARIGTAFDIVLIHDGARPFIDQKMIKDSIGAAARHGAGVVAVPESDTVKLTDGRARILKTLPRGRIYRAQTPQAFRLGLIKRAYERACGVNFTDDSSLVERLGKAVKAVPGSYGNMKITTREDMRMAEAFL